eukprot:GHVT01029910.1.p1 GENE.GHVT01029910.1~~GHVT01029910.1.p1  ORF type:complete len:127 (-),score=13.20 GHVT01029910.1:938-1318(-)
MFQKAKVHQKGLVNKNTKKLKVKLPAGFVCARPDCLEDKRFTFWIHFLDSLFGFTFCRRRGSARCCDAAPSPPIASAEGPLPRPHEEPRQRQPAHPSHRETPPATNRRSKLHRAPLGQALATKIST